MSGVRTYDPSQVIVTINGANMSGFADGTFVTIERDEQSFTKVIGADGTSSRSKTSNRSGMLTITLAQTSPSNDILSALLAQDEASSDAVFSVQVKDNSGDSRVFSGTGWVQGMPSIEYGKDMSNREWVIELVDMEFNIAGNALLGSA